MLINLIRGSMEQFEQRRSPFVNTILNLRSEYLRGREKVLSNVQFRIDCLIFIFYSLQSFQYEKGVKFAC